MCFLLFPHRVAAGQLLFGQVPMLEVDGLHLVQSHSIMRYVAGKHGWYEGLDLATVARIDMLAEGTEDVRWEEPRQPLPPFFSTSLAG